MCYEKNPFTISFSRKPLITVDEIADTPQMRDLSSVFQSLIGENLPIYFLGTAIQENNDKDSRYMAKLYRILRAV